MKRYKEYKDSGIKWIGEIPKEWEIKQMKHIISNEPYSMVDGPFGSDMKNEEYVDSGIPIIQLNNIGIGEHKLNTINYITENKAEQLKRHKAYAGEIVMAKMAEPVARATILSNEYEQYIVSADCIRVKVSSMVDSKFIVYALNSYMRKEAEILSTGTTRIRINLSIAKNLHIAVPTLSQQIIITDYLDRKTAGIDALIADTQRLIDLLREKRQASIGEAVTKGLDKTAKMKDSGIRWIGNIPSTWKVCKLKYFSNMKSGNSISSEDINQEGNFPVYGGNGLRGYTSSFTNNGKYILIGRQGALCGNVRLVEGQFWATEHAVVVYEYKCVSKHWYIYLLDFMNLNQYSTSAAQPGLSVEQIMNLSACFPSYDEQKSIAEYLDRKTTQIDSLISDITEQIEKLKEYRQAVISEVVTGKVAV